jgi:hypothetical protein
MFAGRYAYHKFDDYMAEVRTTQHIERLLAQGPEAARVEAKEQLASASAQNKPKVAAASFHGYYLLHTRGYYDYCRQRYGIDITSYVTTFSDAHRVEFEKAKLILSRGVSGFTEEKVWAMIKTGVERAVAREMPEIEKTYGMSQADICQALNANAQAIVDEVRFSKINPDEYNILSAASVPAQ